MHHIEVEQKMEFWSIFLRSHEMRLASDEETEVARATDAEYHELARVWACNHCDAHIAPCEPTAKKAILHHLVDE